MSLELCDRELIGAILDKKNKCYIAFCRFPFNVKQGNFRDILKDNFFASSFNNISVVFTLNSSILTPSSFYKKEHLTEYLSFSRVGSSAETPSSDYIKNLDCYNLYTVNTELIKAILDFFPNAVIRHHSSIFITYSLIQNNGDTRDKVNVYVFEKYMEVVALKKGGLALYNRFNYENTNDFLYYLIWVYEQLQLDTRKTDCLLYGEVTLEQINFASKYVRVISEDMIPGNWKFADALVQLTPKRYYTLFAQYFCI